MANINAHLTGKTVTVLPAFQGNVLAADFPGWGDDNYAEYLHRPTIGMTGTIRNVESHGNAPFTRYSVKFADGTSASGLTMGTDIEVTP